MLGVGAGGSIEQHIERDTHDPRIWDVANSKLLNIQIVDATTFRTVTGLNPPETPISAQTYQEIGLPFFKLWRDELSADGVAGQWDSITGVADAMALKRRAYLFKLSRIPKFRCNGTGLSIRRQPVRRSASSAPYRRTRQQLFDIQLSDSSSQLGHEVIELFDDATVR
ncbi:hypothetical protein BU26DRAFT_567307 [Trematosphaeria pertusa]|uniref:Uncharacterized protein n=1 Tax=Trematosphaeria pertusa TaxID=390896 RepID=A0A6A6I9D8_9PLEO|nr:uncharacterized protein BU26DRAFT_567307 [Trematosphaeria pertusa]KAF2246981.1 hypothetical protein BU26DRAFT_567307 [Trematosphaeria pertusa]